MTDETPLEAFLEGCDRALFLAFREKCPHLSKTDIAGQFHNYECDHPENKGRHTFKVQGSEFTHTPLAQCALSLCPIFKRLEDGVRLGQDFDTIFHQFRQRMEELVINA